MLDILAEAVAEITSWLQTAFHSPESGGYMLGYQHAKTKNITLELVTSPQPKDQRSIISYKLIDEAHYRILEKAKKNHSYYLGTWHTHPQKHPTPSSTDWNDWYATIEANRTACGYVFFLITGIESFEIWAGDTKSKKISKLHECSMVCGLYKPNRYFLGDGCL